MATINGLHGLTLTAPAPRRTARSFGPRFDALLSADAEAMPVAGVGVLSSLDSLLALQEREDDAAADRRAKSHGAAMLDALSGVQIALLQPDGVTTAQLSRLAGLTRSIPFAANTSLRELAQSIGLRARIELVKRGQAI